MNLLLDTHILIWTLNEDPRLSAKAKELILNPNHVVYYSSVSIWEIAIKPALRPDSIEFKGKKLSEYCEEAGFLPMEMRNRHVFALETLKRLEDAPKHQDPFYRVLITQANAEKMYFLTHDSLIPYYGEKCIILVVQ